MARFPRTEAEVIALAGVKTVKYTLIPGKLLIVIPERKGTGKTVP